MPNNTIRVRTKKVRRRNKNNGFSKNSYGSQAYPVPSPSVSGTKYKLENLSVFTHSKMNIDVALDLIHTTGGSLTSDRLEIFFANCTVCWRIVRREGRDYILELSSYHK